MLKVLIITAALLAGKRTVESVAVKSGLVTQVVDGTTYCVSPDAILDVTPLMSGSGTSRQITDPVPIPALETSNAGCTVQIVGRRRGPSDEYG